ncbi:MarR family winged helix-turn-helix transcriptional regulator [Arthrobacter sp. L77]|uniref:MarR family winged helix-turn-helix transcriptional regulator n=1 Tax=Arthrobacter sp. L77 TaxID=1496689 RepID=UPI0018CE049F|nr:MarR family transcriptional regulator [Arthrobacter sp. L77]
MEKQSMYGRETRGQEQSGTESTNLIDELMGRFSEIRELENQAYRDHRDAHRLNDRDMATLGFLSEEWKAGRTVSPRDIASTLNMSSATTTVILDRLEAEGYFHRRRSTSDRRAVFLEPGEQMKSWLEDHPLEILRRSAFEIASRIDSIQVEHVNRYLGDVLTSARDRIRH